MSKPKVILVHGNGGATAAGHWIPYVKKHLEAKGFTVVAQTMPDNFVARESVWLPFLKDELGVDENTIIIGHSSGAVAAMRFAESNKIYGSVLVGACHTDLGDDDEKASGYYDHEWHWDKIKANQNWIIQFASTNDPYIPIEEARYIHEKLGTEYFESETEGHYGSDVQEKLVFPELIDAIMNKF